jgi:hypothetical protein
MTIYSNSPVIGESQLSLIKPTAIDNKCIDVELTVEQKFGAFSLALAASQGERS